MQKFVFHMPTEIVFGEDTQQQAGALCKKYGAKKVFVIYGKESAKKSGLINEVMESLRAEGLDCMDMGGVVANPLLSTTRKMIKEALAFEADFLLAVGGGSVIDTTKAVAHGIAMPTEDVWDYWVGKRTVEKSTPFGSVLTISAAGSETSDSAVITNDEIEVFSKRGINTPFNKGKFTIMNPRLTMTLPKYQIGAGAADILMHTLERYFAIIEGNHLTDEMAAGLSRNIIKYGKMAVQNPNDYEAMSEVMWSGSISHNGLTGIGAKGDTVREGDWACHQLGMTISALYDSTHGATLSAVWGSWARYVKDTNIKRFVKYAHDVFGIEEVDNHKATEAGISATEQYFKDLGMPICLTDLLNRTPSEKELAKMASVCSYQNTRTIGAFKTLDEKDILAIYKAAV